MATRYNPQSIIPHRGRMTQPHLSECDSDYECVMTPVTPETVQKSTTLSIKGAHIEIPSRHLFVTEDGSVYVVVKRRGNKAEYASLKSLIETVNKTTIIEGFSTPP